MKRNNWTKKWSIDGIHFKCAPAWSLKRRSTYEFADTWDWFLSFPVSFSEEKFLFATSSVLVQRFQQRYWLRNCVLYMNSDGEFLDSNWFEKVRKPCSRYSLSLVKWHHYSSFSWVCMCWFLYIEFFLSVCLCVWVFNWTIISLHSNLFNGNIPMAITRHQWNSSNFFDFFIDHVIQPHAIAATADNPIIM